MSAVVAFPGDEQRRIPPHSYEAEQALLAALLSHNATYPQIAGAVQAEDFADAVHGRIFAAACKLIEGGHVANALTLGNHFDADGALAEVGGARYLAQLQNAVVTLIGVEDYARTIRDLADRRRLIAAAEEAIEDAYAVDIDRPASQIAANLSGELTTAIGGRDDGFLTLADVAERVVEDLGRDVPCDATGLPSLDSALEGGLFAEKLYAINARKKNGKTLLMATIAKNLDDRGVPCLYLGLEMTPSQITQRILAAMMGFNSLAFLNPRWRKSEDFLAKAAEAAVRLRSGPGGLLFQRRPRMPLDALRQTIAKAALTRKVRGVFVDYVQLVSGQRRGQSKSEFLDEVTQTLDEATKQYGIWIVAASQLNQQGNVRGGEGVLNACDMALKLHKIEQAAAPDRAWLEMTDTRYTPTRDVGSADEPALEIDTKAGPFFRDIAASVPAIDPETIIPD